MKKPIYIFVTILASVFMAEFLIMIVLSLLPPLTLYKKAFLDAFLLSVVAYPILFLLVVRPLKRHIAERYRAETRFEQIAENAQEWIWEVDAKGLYLYASPVVERILGYTPAEIVGKKHFYDLFHPNKREEFKEAAFKVFAQKHPFRGFTNRNVHKEGHDVWLSTSGVPVSDDKGNLLGYRGADTDITERREKEETIRISEQKYRKLFEEALDGIALADATTGELIDCNEALSRLVGRKKSELIGKSQTILHPPRRTRSKFSETFEQHLGNQEGQVVETQVITKAGDMKEVAIKANLFELRSRKVLQGIFRDITERKRAEEERSRLVTAVEQAGEMIIVTDTDGIVQFVNPAFEAVTGYSREEAIDRHIEALVKGGEYDEMLHRHLSETLGRGEIWRGRFTGRKKDGSLYLADSTISPVRDAAGDIVSYVRVERDLTDQLALEAKVQQAQKLESLGLLAGGIAHDFNNLMMGILGNADLALMDLPPEASGRYYIKEIETAAERVAKLTNQMLAYSGKGRFVVEPIDLNLLLEEMKQLQQTVISKKATLQFHLAQNLPALEADAGQVRQVVMNLITNASEAIGDSNGAIGVTTGVVEADRTSLSGSYLNEDVPQGRYVYLEVSDTGSGMDAKTQEKIFDPFFTTKFTGRGLGLAAVLGIVRGHRGVIQVSSDPGRGSTFKILFPCVGDLAVVREEQAIMVESAGPGATILVVDDDEAVRDVLKLMLEAAGYRVLTAADGREGVSVFRQHCEEISLVLLDMTMPHMDGKEAFREMRLIRSDVWVILSSGYNELDATRQFADNGLTGFIQKPYRSSTLLTKIQEGPRQA